MSVAIGAAFPLWYSPRVQMWLWQMLVLAVQRNVCCWHSWSHRWQTLSKCGCRNIQCRGARAALLLKGSSLGLGKCVFHHVFLLTRPTGSAPTAWWWWWTRGDAARTVVLREHPPCRTLRVSSPKTLLGLRSSVGCPLNQTVGGCGTSPSVSPSGQPGLPAALAVGDAEAGAVTLPQGQTGWGPSCPVGLGRRRLF